MELLYNPEQMDAAELRETFVGRDGLIEELLALIEHQPEGPGVQHAVIIASRGMGKTTVLLMVRLLLAERGLTNQWLALKFPEESWGISDTSDLWCETLVRIAGATGETELERNAVSLRETAEPGGDIADAALALIRDWSRRSGKRLLLMIENLDTLFDQFSDEQELARLRDVLMNDGRIMLLGSATSYFHEAQGYEQPLYNFFKVYNLNEFDLEEVKSLLSRRAMRDAIPNFDEKLAAEVQRLKALRHFTGGNPRLVLMLYRVITLTDIGEVHSALEKLLDEITPYYQAKTLTLPPQQRKILDHLARAASESHEGLTPQQIAEGTRLSPNQVSAQLRRLTESGYVAAAALRGRNTFYSLSEPLYSVWYQMRFGNESRRRFGWLLTFLKLWYSVEEILQAGHALDTHFSECLRTGRIDQARKHLEIHGYIAEALGESADTPRVWESVVQGYARLGDAGWLQKNLSREQVLRSLGQETREALCEAGYFQFPTSSTLGGRDAVGRLAGPVREACVLLDRAKALHEEGREAEAVALHDQVVERFGDSKETAILEEVARALVIKGWTLARMGRNDAALKAYGSVVERFGDSNETELRGAVADALLRQGMALGKVGRNQEALGVYDTVINRFSEANEPTLLELVAGALVRKGVTLGRVGRLDDELSIYDVVIERFGTSKETSLLGEVCHALFHKAGSLSRMGRYDEVIYTCDSLIERFGQSDEFAPTIAQVMFNKGTTLWRMGRNEGALAAYETVFERFGNSDDEAVREWVAHALQNKVLIQLDLEQFEQIKPVWVALKQFATNSSPEQRSRLLLVPLISIVRAGRTELAQQLLADSSLDERLFPLTRALDYVISGKPEYIEKLPPELRSVVAEIVTKLPKPKGQPTGGARAGKSKRAKRGGSSRSRKKLT